MWLFVKAIASGLVTTIVAFTPRADVPCGCAPDPSRPVPFDLVAMMSGTAATNLAPGFPLRLEGADDHWWFKQVFAQAEDEPLARELRGMIAERYPNRLPAGTALLVGNVYVGCSEAESVEVLDQGDGTVTFFGRAPRDESRECFAPVTTVAAVAVDADAVPPGSTDQAELVAFESLGAGATRHAVELDGSGDDEAALRDDGIDLPDLPDVDDNDRRFAFVWSGCRHTSAELIVTRATLDARLETDPGTEAPLCDEAEWFLAVFDVRAGALPSTAVLAEA